jgi:hypothetical protein
MPPGSVFTSMSGGKNLAVTTRNYRSDERVYSLIFIDGSLCFLDS